MNALFLPGASKQNKEWIHNFSNELRDLFEIRIVHEYGSWRIESAEVNLEVEPIRISNTIKHLNQPYVVIAKSIGTFFALSLIAENKLRPEKCILLGVPIKLLESFSDLKSIAQNNSKPTLIMQNTNDPVSSFKDITKYFSSWYNYHAHELPGETHSYMDFQTIKKLIGEFI